MRSIKKTRGGNTKQFGMLIALGVIIFLFQVLTSWKKGNWQPDNYSNIFQTLGNFLTSGNMLKPMNVSNLVFQNAYVIVLAIGMLLCILTGGNIDLSVGSTVALVGAFAGVFIINWGLNVYLSIAMCLGIGICLGMWQGFWIAYVGIPPFICTLAGMLVFRGITLLILDGQTIAPFPPEYQRLFTGFIPDIATDVKLFGTKINLLCLLTGVAIALIFCVIQLTGNLSRKRKGYEYQSAGALAIKLTLISAALIWVFSLLARYRGIPTVLVLLGALLLIYSFFTQKTVKGRHLYAIGGNVKAARLSGIKTKQMMFFAYTNMSFIAAIGGLVFAARLNSASPVAGQGFEMDAIASCFIGGASAYGGTGTIGGALIGALIMGVLNNGMSLMSINANAQQVVKGLVLLGAVAFDVISKMNLDWSKLKILTKPFRPAKRKDVS